MHPKLPGLLSPRTSALVGGRPSAVAAVDLFWFAGMSCDGCSVALTGAGGPPLEDLLRGRAGLPQVVLHHPFLAFQSGAAFLEPYRQALRGQSVNPYVLVLEGSATDESLAGDGYWAAQGSGTPTDAEARAVDGVRQPLATMEWVRALAPGAAAAVAIGTCATWGGVPAALGNVTGAMSLGDLLGAGYRGTLGLPVVNVPGCSPIGDNIMETLAALLLAIVGLGPPLDVDELGRPAWLFTDTVHRRCDQAGYYEEGAFASRPGDGGCLAELGCWGPVVQCNITTRGSINGRGGCMTAGGACIGCTMPGFPDRFTPFYQSVAGSAVTALSREAPSRLHALHALHVLDPGSAGQLMADAPPPTAAELSGWSFVDRPGEADGGDEPFYDRWRPREETREPAGVGAGPAQERRHETRLRGG